MDEKDRIALDLLCEEMMIAADEPDDLDRVMAEDEMHRKLLDERREHARELVKICEECLGDFKIADRDEVVEALADKLAVYAAALK